MHHRAASTIATVITAIAAAGLVALVIDRLPASPLIPQLPSSGALLANGENPHPVRLIRPERQPLSAVAQLGRLLFFDANLSSSGRLACASCHSPQYFYAPADAGSTAMGGRALASRGVRAVPSLMYLERRPNFSIGPDAAENEGVNLAQFAALGQIIGRGQKTAVDIAASSTNVVPQGGLFWDGRADTLQQQALFPLLSPTEMDAGSIDVVATKLRRAPYADRFMQLFGAAILDTPRLLVAEAMFAIGRYEIEYPSFHPYSSKFDLWLEGRARLDAAEMRGYLAFNDPAHANCAGCHLDQPTPDRLPPLFTDHQFEALGAPRNPILAANRDPTYFDLGLCGPYRTDMQGETQYCGMFGTPTLRNTATRHVWFHNGVYSSLQQVLDFYNFRDVMPEKVYPQGPDGTVIKFDDLPAKYRGNIDIIDAPFDRMAGDQPPMTAQDERDVIAFLQTLTDGYQSAR